MGDLKAAVIGYGVMGMNHARVYRTLSSVETVMAIDPDPDSAKRAFDADMHVARWDIDSGFKILEDQNFNVASITCPTSLHAEMAIKVMELGIDVLVEKPIAHTIRDARNMIDCAEANDRVLMVGHIVRYDPITFFIKGLVVNGTLGEIWRISTRRIGPSPDRVRDVGVSVDLTTHDIDAMRWILAEDPREVSALARYRDHGDKFEDQIDGWVEFSGGVTGIIEADWLTPIKHRSMVICGSKGIVRADYVRRAVMTHLFSNLPDPDGVSIKWFSKEKYEEPLRLEIRQFVLAVIGRRIPPITGADGLFALRTALAMVQSSQSAKAVQL